MNDSIQALEEMILQRDIKKAETTIARYLRDESQPIPEVDLLIYRARVRLVSARLDDALADLAVAQSIAPERFEQPHMLELLGDCYFGHFELASVGFADRADTAHALAAYNKIILNFPNYENLGWVYYQFGRVVLTENHIEEAIQCFTNALMSASTIRSLTSFCYERLGFIAFYESRNLQQAIAFLNKAIDTYPADEPQLWLAQVHTLRGKIYRENNEHDHALEAIDTAVKIAAMDGGDTKIGLVDALLKAGEIASDMEGRETEAIYYLNQFIQNSRRPVGVDVTWSRVHEMLGDAYSRIEQYKSAVDAYRLTLKYNPYHPWEMSLYYRLARNYYEMGDFKQTVASIEMLLKVASAENYDIDDYRIYYVLGNAWYSLGKYSSAVDAYEKALELSPLNGANVENLRQYHQQAIASVQAGS